MKILLIQPNYRITRESSNWRINPPLGLTYIAAVLEQHGFRPEILDANALNITPEEIAKRAIDCDIIGISAMTPAHGFVTQLVKLLPQQTLKVVGGPHATGFVDTLLSGGYDIVVRGEGEHTMLEVCERKPLEKILGISYRRGGNIVHNDNRPVLDPDNLPLPARHLLIANGCNKPYASAATERFPWAPILTSRGCPYNCYYCNKLVFGRKFRPRKPESVVDEITHLQKTYGVREIDIVDDIFNFDMSRAERILNLIIERDIKISIRCSNGIIANKVSQKFLKKMKRAGCTYIAYGVESGNQAVLDSIPKGETLDDIRNAVKWTKTAGIPVTGFFILGFLTDTPETMQQTIDFAKELDVNIASFTIATPYPGTHFYDLVKSKGELLMTSWENFHHTSGRATYRYPGGPDPTDVEATYKRAFKEYYFRPSFVLRRLFDIRSFMQLRIFVAGGIAIFKTVKREV